MRLHHTRRRQGKRSRGGLARTSSKSSALRRFVVQLISLKSDVPLISCPGEEEGTEIGLPGLWAKPRSWPPVLSWGLSPLLYQHPQAGPSWASGASTAQCDPRLVQSLFSTNLLSCLLAAALKLFPKPKGNTPPEWVVSFSWIPGKSGRKRRSWLQLRGCGAAGQALASRRPPALLCSPSALLCNRETWKNPQPDSAVEGRMKNLFVCLRSHSYKP